MLICALGTAILLYGLLWGIFADGTSWVAYHFTVLTISGSVFVAFSFLVREDFGLPDLMTWLWRFSCLLLLMCMLEIFLGIRLPVSRYSSLAPSLGFAYEGSDGASEIFQGLWVPTGFFGNQNNLSFTLLCILPFLTAASRTVTARVVMVAMASFVIFISESRIALLVLLIWSVTSTCIFVVRRVSALNLFALFAVAAAAVPLAYQAFENTCADVTTKLCFGVTVLQTVDIDDLMKMQDSIGVRVQLARQSLQLWASAPLLGVGPGHLSELVSAVYAEGILITDPHNPPVQILAEYGVLGAALWVIAVGVVLRSALATPQQPAEVARFRKATLTLLIIVPFGSVAISAVYYFIPIWVLLGAVFGATIELSRPAAHKRSIVRQLGIITRLAVRSGGVAAAEDKK